MDQDAASVDEDVSALLPLEPAYGLNRILPDNSRVAPCARGFQRRRHYVLADRVHGVAAGIVLHRLEGAAVYLPGLATEENRVGLRHRLKEASSDIVVPIRPCPASLPKIPLRIFVRPA